MIQKTFVVLVLIGLFGLTAGKEIPLSQPEDLYALSLEELMNINVAELVSSASKHPQNLADAPSSVTIITSEEIRKYGYRTLQDIFEAVPGFYTTYDRNYGYLGVRGFGRPGDYNSRIIILLDGHPLNEGIANSWGLMRDFHLDPDLIQKIEIIRGPGSALYGSNALFAVINILTKSAEDSPGTEIAALYTSQDARQGRLTYGTQFSDRMGLLVSATGFQNDGERLYYPEFDDPSTNHGRVNNDDEQAGSFFVKGSFSDFTLTVAHNDREKGVPTSAWETVFNHRGTRTWDSFTLIGLSWQHELAEDLSALARISYHHYNYSGRWIFDDGGIYANKEWWKARSWESEVQLTKTFSSHRLTFGAEGKYHVRQDQKNWDFEVYLNTHRHSKTWGVYIQDEWKILDTLTLYAGFRHDFSETNHQNTPRFGLVYRPAEATSIKLLYGKAFRDPSPYETDYTDGYTTRPNPNLKQETIKTYELVWEQKFSKTWKGSLSGYYYKAENLINQTEDSEGWIVFENLDSVTAKGIEAVLEGRWEDGMRCRLGYAYVRTFNQATRSALANSPEHMVTVNWIYPLVPDRLFAGFETKYTAKRKTLSGSYTNEALITNLTLTYDNLLENMDLQIGLYNLTDEEYSHPAFEEHLQDTLEQDGRTVGVKVFFRF
jgi:iron complex outermembrane receptor protein